MESPSSADVLTEEMATEYFNRESSSGWLRGLLLYSRVNVNLRRFLRQWVVLTFNVPAVLVLQCFSHYALPWPLPAIIVPMLCVLDSVASYRRARCRLATLS
jgi:hypothetical protein